MKTKKMKRTSKNGEMPSNRGFIALKLSLDRPNQLHRTTRDALHQSVIDHNLSHPNHVDPMVRIWMVVPSVLHTLDPKK